MESYPSHAEARFKDSGAVSIDYLIERAMLVGEFAFDLETTGLDPRADAIDGIALYVPATAKHEHIRAWYPFVPRTVISALYACPCGFQTFDKWDCTVKDDSAQERVLCVRCDESVSIEDIDIRPAMDFTETMARLKPLFEATNVCAVAHNVKFDASFIHHLTDIKIKNRIADSMIACYVMDENLRQYGLKTLAPKFLGVTMASFKEASLKAQEVFSFERKKPLGVYAMDDVEYCYKLKEFAIEKMREQDPKGDLEAIFWRIEMPIAKVIEEMETTGVLIDWDHLVKVDARLEKKQREVFDLRLAEMTADWVRPINIRSPRDKSDFLFCSPEDGGLGLPTRGLERGKSGDWPTAEKAIKHLRYCNPAVGDLLEWSSLDTLRSGFTIKLAKLAQESPDGRIYSHFNQTGTVIGRLSSSNPVNLQNQPREPGLVRDAYCAHLPTAPNDMILFGADFSQIELRVVAHLANEATMISVYSSAFCTIGPCETFKTEGKCRHMDLHQRTAEDVGVPRQIAKALNFGTLYRIGAPRFCENANLYTEKGVPRIAYATDILGNWLKVYKGIPKFHRAVAKELHGNGFISYTLTKRRRRLEKMRALNEFRAITQGIQFAVSGSAQDIMKLSMTAVCRERDRRAEFGPRAERKQWARVKMILQVHDEMVLEGPGCLDHEVCEMMKSCMEGAVDPGKFRVPLVVEAKSGRTWADIH